jgi:hypothetical protein
MLKKLFTTLSELMWLPMGNIGRLYEYSITFTGHIKTGVFLDRYKDHWLLKQIGLHPVRHTANVLIRLHYEVISAYLLDLLNIYHIKI